MRLKYIMLLTVIIGISVQAKASELPPTPFSTQDLQTACENIHVYGHEFESDVQTTHPNLERLLKEFCIAPLRYPKAFSEGAGKNVVAQAAQERNAIYSKISKEIIKINEGMLIVFAKFGCFRETGCGFRRKYEFIYPQDMRGAYSIYENSDTYLRLTIRKYRDDLVKKSGF